MKVLVRSYDLDDLGGSGVTLRTIARYLAAQGAEVWATHTAQTLAEVRAWAPDLVIGQQWAIEEASRWATALAVPFVMLVHGPGQYDQFMPQCDLVIFNTHGQHELARSALGRTPCCVVHPPVFRADYGTEGAGTCVTLIGSGSVKGVDVFLVLARALPEETFLLVTDDAVAELPQNVEVHAKTADVRAIYARTKLLVMPSTHEPYGRVAVEAAMSGIPCVGADLPGIREATDGLAVLVGEDESWEAAVRQVLANLEPHRQAAQTLARLCDPEADLAKLYAQLRQLAVAGRRRPTLSLVMTVANEAQTLEKAVESVAAFVDEIIIGVDQKSTDDTAVIARRLATQYFEYSETSPPDFPRMRNRAMALVQTDWAIVLDGHEWIEHAELIRPALETTAWSIEIETLFQPDENRVPGLAFPFPRIHRRHVRFVGAAAHEEVSTPLERRNSRREIKVWHERKPGAAASIRSQEKANGELDHLRVAWLERGDRRALFYLANGLREAGRYAEAIAAYEDYLQAPNFPEEGWQAMLYQARCHSAQQQGPQARRLLEQAILACPERAEAAVDLGHLLLHAGEPQAAAAWFRMAASLPFPAHSRLFVEVPVYRWVAWHGLALALDRLGEWSGAAEAEQRAQAGGAGPWAAHNVALWQARAATRQEVGA